MASDTTEIIEIIDDALFYPQDTERLLRALCDYELSADQIEKRDAP